MRKKEKNEAIYDAAMGVFAEYGYRKATMDDIAAALGMTKGNLYLYVKDKKDLYEKSVGYELLRWQGLVREAVDRESDPKKQFLVMGEKALEYLARDNDLRRVLVRDPDIFPMFPVRDPYQQVNRNSVALIRSILKRGMEKGVFRSVKLDSLPEVLFSIYKMLVIRTYIAQEGTSMRRMFAETLEVVTLGIFKQPRARRGTGKQ
ncbi:MAG TPA: TetR/AcrR family transcriptional regulator [Spirochaetota bacterium]|nr:TetR/AcrR family transcriptional regulator [Spirochaetota bacterium]